MCPADPNDLMRSIPGVDRLLDVLGDQDLPRGVVLTNVRETLDELRQSIRDGEKPTVDVQAVAMRVRERLDHTRARRIQPVLNATGIIVHTNLGRSPMADQAVQAARQAAGR